MLRQIKIVAVVVSVLLVTTMHAYVQEGQSGECEESQKRSLMWMRNEPMPEAKQKLQDQLLKEIHEKVDSMVEDFKKEKKTKMNFISKDGLRQTRYYKRLVERSVNETYVQSYNKMIQEFRLAIKNDSASEHFDEQNIENKKLLESKEQEIITAIRRQVHDELTEYAKKNILLMPKPLKKNFMNKKKDGDVDPYKDKKMEYITEEMRQWKPLLQDEYVYTSKGNRQRKMFGHPLVIPDDEEADWQKFLKWYEAKHGKTVDQKYLDTKERRGHRILYYRFNDMEQTDLDFQWRENFDHKREVTPKMKKYLENGPIYVSGRMTELGLQPVMMIEMAKLKHVKHDDMSELFMIVIQWIEDNVFIWGSVESVLTVIDFRNVKLTDIPVRALINLVMPIFKMSMGWGFHGICVNMSWILVSIFNMVKGIFDEVSQETIFMYTPEDSFQAFLGYLSVDDIEEKFGGNKPNVNIFYPPVY